MPLLPDHADAERWLHRDRRDRLLPAALASLAGHGALLAACLANAPAGQPIATPAVIAVTLVAAPAIEAAAVAEPTGPAAKPVPVPAAVAAAQPAASPPPAPAPQSASVAAEAHRHARPAKPRPDRRTLTVQAAPSLAVESGLPPASSAPSPQAASFGQQSPAMSVASAPQAVAPAAPVVSAPSADYLAAVMAALERQKRYPEAARLRQEQGTVLIDFAIDHGGRVLSARIRRGSGSASLDNAAEAMVHQADPLPPPPASYAAARLELVLPVTFSLE